MIVEIQDKKKPTNSYFHFHFQARAPKGFSHPENLLHT
jgi:hypothetical protein